MSDRSSGIAILVVLEMLRFFHISFAGFRDLIVCNDCTWIIISVGYLFFSVVISIVSIPALLLTSGVPSINSTSCVSSF